MTFSVLLCCLLIHFNFYISISLSNSWVKSPHVESESEKPTCPKLSDYYTMLKSWCCSWIITGNCFTHSPKEVVRLGKTANLYHHPPPNNHPTYFNRFNKVCQQLFLRQHLELISWNACNRHLWSTPDSSLIEMTYSARMIIKAQFHAQDDKGNLEKGQWQKPPR